MYVLHITREVDTECRHAKLDFASMDEVVHFLDFLDSCIGFSSVLLLKGGDFFEEESSE